jgi:flagellar hook-basal body complex protein FliE
MDFFDSSTVQGGIVRVERTDPRHLAGKVHKQEDTGGEASKNFGGLVSDALNRVNDLSQQSSEMSQQFITDPESVDAHDVTIAMSKANLAVSMTKKVVDEALQAYNKIINLR